MDSPDCRPTAAVQQGRTTDREPLALIERCDPRRARPAVGGMARIESARSGSWHAGVAPAGSDGELDLRVTERRCGSDEVSLQTLDAPASTASASRRALPFEPFGGDAVATIRGLRTAGGAAGVVAQLDHVDRSSMHATRRCTRPPVTCHPREGWTPSAHLRPRGRAPGAIPAVHEGDRRHPPRRSAVGRTPVCCRALAHCVGRRVRQRPRTGLGWINGHRFRAASGDADAGRQGRDALVRAHRRGLEARVGIGCAVPALSFVAGASICAATDIRSLSNRTSVTRESRRRQAGHDPPPHRRVAPAEVGSIDT